MYECFAYVRQRRVSDPLDLESQVVVNPGPLQEHPVFLMAEPSLQPVNISFKENVCTCWCLYRWMRINGCTCTCVPVCVEATRQTWVLSSGTLSTSFDTESLIGLDLKDWARLAGQWIPGIPSIRTTSSWPRIFYIGSAEPNWGSHAFKDTPLPTEPFS